MQRGAEDLVAPILPHPFVIIRQGELLVAAFYHIILKGTIMHHMLLIVLSHPIPPFFLL